MSTQQTKFPTSPLTRADERQRVLPRLRDLLWRYEYCLLYLTWKSQMFVTTFNSNDGLIWLGATIGTSAFGNPVVLAAIISGVFVLIGKLIENRTKRRNQAEITDLITAQNDLLSKIFSSNPQAQGKSLTEGALPQPDSRPVKHSER
jgi:hypothetical protein